MKLLFELLKPDETNGINPLLSFELLLPFQLLELLLPSPNMLFIRFAPLILPLFELEFEEFELLLELLLELLELFFELLLFDDPAFKLESMLLLVLPEFPVV